MSPLSPPAAPHVLAQIQQSSFSFARQHNLSPENQLQRTSRDAMTRRSESGPAPPGPRRPSLAPSTAPAFISTTRLHQRASSYIGAAEEGHDHAAAAATDALHEEIDEIKRYEVREVRTRSMINTRANKRVGLYNHRFVTQTSTTNDKS